MTNWVVFPVLLNSIHLIIYSTVPYFKTLFSQRNLIRSINKTQQEIPKRKGLYKLQLLAMASARKLIYMFSVGVAVFFLIDVLDSGSKLHVRPFSPSLMHPKSIANVIHSFMIEDDAARNESRLRCTQVT